MHGVNFPALFAFVLAACLFVTPSLRADEIDPVALPQSLNDYPHAQSVSFSRREVIDHQVGLGAMRKVRGDWGFKDSERLSGTLLSYTWQIVDGFTSKEVMDRLVQQVEGMDSASKLFSCEGRACGHGAQWANRVFRERVLYGREDLQRYAVYALGKSPDKF